jgi:hypothetical protein
MKPKALPKRALIEETAQSSRLDQFLASTEKSKNQNSKTLKCDTSERKSLTFETSNITAVSVENLFAKSTL